MTVIKLSGEMRSLRRIWRLPKLTRFPDLVSSSADFAFTLSGIPSGSEVYV
jgi:hypothetical protein